MILRLVLEIIAILAALVGVIATGHQLAKPLLEARRRQRLGRRNAEETCHGCLGPVDPAEDVFDRRWYHRTCYQKLLQP